MTTTTFRVEGLEMCRVLAATALFQASPRTDPGSAAVRCFARYDGLSLIALNGGSLAVGHVDVDDLDDPAVFSVPAAQVKAILAIFKRALPKEAGADEYVLEVTVTDRAVRIRDVSALFEGDEYLMAVMASEDLGVHEQSDAERAMSAAATAMGLLGDTEGFDLASGVFFSPDNIGRVARAAKVLGLPVHMQPAGRCLVAALGSEFVAVVGAGRYEREPGGPPRFVDGQALVEMRGRLDELVNQAVL